METTKTLSSATVAGCLKRAGFNQIGWEDTPIKMGFGVSGMGERVEVRVRSGRWFSRADELLEVAKLARTLIADGRFTVTGFHRSQVLFVSWKTEGVSNIDPEPLTALGNWEKFQIEREKLLQSCGVAVAKLAQAQDECIRLKMELEALDANAPVKPEGME